MKDNRCDALRERGESERRLAIHDRQDEDCFEQFGQRSRVAGVCDLREFCRCLEENGPEHWAYYHYSSWEALRSMMEPKRLDMGESRVLWLSRARDMNDKIEKAWGDRVYFACFSYSRYEDVAMWMNYGKKSPEAIRIRFDGRRVKNWYAAHKTGKTGVYAIDEKNKTYTAIPPRDIEAFQLVDVAYVIPSRMTQGRLNGNVEYARQFFIVEDKGSKDWADAIYSGVQDELTGVPPYFKKRGWGYERETRLIIRLKEGVKAGAHLAVDFEEPYQGLEEVGHSDLKHRNSLMHGPWFKKDSPRPKQIERLKLNLEDLVSSDYKDEIDILSLCGSCQYTFTPRAPLTDEEIRFVKAAENVIYKVAKTINYHFDRGDFTPNPIKMAALKDLDLLRLIELSKRDRQVGVYLDRLAEIESSRQTGWRKKVGMVEQYVDVN